MASLYKITDAYGNVEYSDRPPLDPRGRKVESVQPGRGMDRDARADYQQAQTLIGEAKKRIPKLNDYLNYLEYLRRNRPTHMAAVMAELKRQDPQTWLLLQRYPQFRLLSESMIGMKAGSKNLEAAAGGLAGLFTGKFSGTLEKWLETSVKDAMKRDRWGPFADVLGSKAGTLPTKEATYSTSRLGQYLKAEDARQATAGAKAASQLKSAEAALRAAKGSVVTRGLGPLVDLGIGLLDTEKASGISALRAMQIAKRLEDKGIFDVYESKTFIQLMTQHRYDEANALLQSAMQNAGQQ
ncbi:hypothetical protein GCM10007860_29980 [Chitiniphilus shinanonensis]|uniref:DUF4124 domain-containing protein n=1 Tax=Chitiniphilus shinanonensis TaxID=553088 RepID=A0ABQ6BWG1_9NEIS|nr:DUF4124 domain-containing protein [Chitiniphilus shinanonensis]GLS05839.1 hypothetical protein GCM10007860_29980 [Chitiniphilus shinanonensis]